MTMIKLVGQWHGPQHTDNPPDPTPDIETDRGDNRRHIEPLAGDLRFEHTSEHNLYGHQTMELPARQDSTLKQTKRSGNR